MVCWWCPAGRGSRMPNAVLWRISFLVIGETSTLSLGCRSDKRKYFDKTSNPQKRQTLKQFDIQYGDQHFHLELETLKVSKRDLKIAMISIAKKKMIIR